MLVDIGNNLFVESYVPKERDNEVEYSLSYHTLVNGKITYVQLLSGIVKFIDYGNIFIVKKNQRITVYKKKPRFESIYPVLPVVKRFKNPKYEDLCFSFDNAKYRITDEFQLEVLR